MSKLAAAHALAKEFDEKLKESGEGTPLDRDAVKRALFGTFAEQWMEAEEAKDTPALEALAELRPKLKLQRRRQSLGMRLSMYVRFLATVFVASVGCMCILMVTPLRLLHPLLRRCGVPNGMLPVDISLTMWGWTILAAAGVKVRLEGPAPREQWAEEPYGIIVYNHASNLDPFILAHVVSNLAPKYLGKKILFALPFFGWMALAVGFVPINRGDRGKAVRTMNETVGNIMRRWGRSVAVAPEGTRTTDGHLRLPFKKGCFYLQEQTRAPVLPVVIFGAYDLWPPGQLFTSTGEVTARVLAQQPCEAGAGSTETARQALQRAMAKDIVKHGELTAQPLSIVAMLECFFKLLCALVVYHQFWSLYAALASAAGLGISGVLGLLVAITLTFAVVVHQLL